MPELTACFADGGAKVVCRVADEKYKAVVEEALKGVPRDAEIIYNGRRNKLYRINRGGEELCVKAFRRPNAVNALVYTNLREGKARRSYEFAKRLRQLGIGTPEPLGYAERKEGARLRESFYICRYIKASTVRDWEKRPDCERLLDALAREMVKIHRARVFHKDFSPGNMLFTVGPDGSYHFYMVDLNRMKFDVGDAKTLMRNFRSIHLDETETARLARHYAKAAGIDEESAVAEATRQLRLYMKSKRRHAALKKIFKRKRK